MLDIGSHKLVHLLPLISVELDLILSDQVTHMNYESRDAVTPSRDIAVSQLFQYLLALSVSNQNSLWIDGKEDLWREFPALYWLHEEE